MAIEDYIETGYCPDEWDEYKVTCKYCGAGNLRWEKEKDKWILIELDINLEEHKHICRHKS